MGGTPDFVAGVWYGYDQPKEIYYGLSGNPSRYFVEDGDVRRV